MAEDRRLEERLARRGGLVEMLRLPAAVFEAVSRARRSLYERGWLPSERVGLSVLSVGNLSVGGTGKTPMVALLAKELTRRGRRVGLLSRGYRAEAAEGPPETAESDELQGAIPPKISIKNDEARELERSLGSEVPHVQGADRVAGARELEGLGVDVAILDDGFQHRRLARDLDLVLVDASRPFGLPATEGGEPVEALLPRGFLREPADALRFAQACIITRSDQVESGVLARLEERLDDLAPGLPVLLAQHRPVALLELVGEEEIDLVAHPEFLRGKRLAALSGIGNPQAFRRTLEDLGGEVVSELRKPDHASCGEEDRAYVSKALAAGWTVVTTAKDAVKLADVLDPDAGRAVQVLLVEQDIVRGESVLEALLDALPRPRRKPPRRDEGW